jgi:hypothetical protein
MTQYARYDIIRYLVTVRKIDYNLLHAPENDLPVANPDHACVHMTWSLGRNRES